MSFLDSLLNLKIKETCNDGKWTMQIGDTAYSMYSCDALSENEPTPDFCGYSPEALFKSGRDLLGEHLLRRGEPDFCEVKNTLPPLKNGTYMILGAAATWHNLTVGIETGEIFPHTKRIYDLPVPIFSPCMLDIKLGRIKPKIFLLGGKFPIVFSVHTDGKDVLEFLYFVEAGDTGKEPVAYIRAKQYKIENPSEFSVSYRIASQSRTAPVRLIAEDTFLSALSDTVIFWSAFDEEGVRCVFPEKTLQNVTEGTMITLATTFTGDHAHYGHRIYGEEFHDNFPPNYIWGLEAACLSGRTAWAKRIFRHMLQYVIGESGRFFYRQGEDELYGASAEEYGQLLFVICRYAKMLGFSEWSKRDFMKIMRLGDVILSHVVACDEFDGMRLIKMCAEADTNTRVHVYLNNNLWGIRGLSALSTLLSLGGFEEGAKAFKEEADALLKNTLTLTKKYSEESRFGLLPPFRFGYTAKPETLSICDDTFSEMSEEEKKAYFVPSFMRDLGADGQDLTENTYANYRYYPEMLSAMYLPRENAEAIINMRENLGGDYMGMVRFMEHLDDWPAVHLARYLLETEKIDKYLLLLYAHTCHHGHPDLMCYYEQVLPGVKPVLNDCVPSLLTSPIMTLWMFAYETVQDRKLSLLRAVPASWFKKGFSVKNIGYSEGCIDISLQDNTLSLRFSSETQKETEIVWRGKEKLEEKDIISGAEYVSSVEGNRIYLKDGITKAEISVRS